MSRESIENITESRSIFAPTFVDHHLLPGMNFSEHCLIKKYFYPWTVNKSVYILHTRSTIKKFNTDFTLGNCLFGSVKPTKDADLDK